MPRLRPGLARVEFFAVRQEVMALLSQGHTYASAYDRLKEAGKISMSYSAFRNYVHARSRQKPEAEDAAARTPPAGTAPPRVSANGAQAFDGKNAVPLSDLLTGE